MLVENENENLIRLADFIFLNRILKLKKTGLSQLFQDPTMNISKILEMKRESIIKLLLPKSTFDGFIIIENLYNFNQNNQEYQQIREMLTTCEKKKIQIFSPLERSLPRIFKNIPSVVNDIVFVKGTINDTDIKSYSICGTREPTNDAIVKTQRIAEIFAKHGLTLINGFAKGIDIEAFKGQMRAGGRYIGVLGSGLENIYPPENKIFISQAIENGALISQRFIHERVNQQSLQIRNQLSAQMTIGSIFIEGTYKSGTRWQFKFSKEANKLNFYLEPKNWDHPSAFICKLVKDEGGIQINNDLSNIDDIVSQFIQSDEVKNFIINPLF